MTREETPNKQVLVSVASERAEAISGVLITIFASLMAISGLIAGNIQESKNEAQSKHSSYFSWYQSKSIKQSLQESHLDLLQTLAKSSFASTDIEAEISKTKIDIKRYKMEKKEIMDGSTNIPKGEWVQELDGKMGVITGVKEWENLAKKLELSVAKFDISNLFFQISVVLGAVCVVIYDNPKLQRSFIISMIISGVFGIFFSFYGYYLSL